MIKAEKEYYCELEQQWRKSLPRFTNQKLLSVFSEARDIIARNVKELIKKRNTQTHIIKKKLLAVRCSRTDDFSKWFCREWIKIDIGQKLVETENQIARLKRIISIHPTKFPKDWITDKQIQQAMEIPIETLTDQPLRKVGKTLIGLCPLHNEKHPSFHIYPETNSCWCFGCNQGGNSINFIRLLHGYSFQEAVKYLVN